MSTYFSIAIIVVSVALVLSILFQVKGGDRGHIRPGGYGFQNQKRRRKNPVPAYDCPGSLIYYCVSHRA